MTLMHLRIGRCNYYHYLFWRFYLATHEGIVPYEIWLTCRKKLMNNMKIQSARKATHTWLTGANNVLLSYVNVKIAELDGCKQELLARIAELTVEAISPEQVSQISGYLDTWENVSFDDKRQVVDLMITTIAATSDSLNITWKI